LIRTPTLVLNRTGNQIVPVEQSRVAAATIEAARFVELPGTDHVAFSEGIDGLVDEVEEFLTGARTGADPDRMLTVSRLDPSGADQVDAEHPSRNR
jgi:hypothetical protein